MCLSESMNVGPADQLHALVMDLAKAWLDVRPALGSWKNVIGEDGWVREQGVVSTRDDLQGRNVAMVMTQIKARTVNTRSTSWVKFDPVMVNGKRKATGYALSRRMHAKSQQEAEDRCDALLARHGWDR
jgi:hypothetical protein